MDRCGSATRPLAGRALALTLALGATPLLAAIGCGDGPTGPDVSGEYELVRANGEPLPALVYDSVWVDEKSGDKALVEAFVERGRLDLLGDGRYDLAFVVDVLMDGEPLLPDEEVRESGEYTVDDSSLRLNASSGASTTGSMSGDEITLKASSEDYGAMTLTFRQ